MDRQLPIYTTNALYPPPQHFALLPPGIRYPKQWLVLVQNVKEVLSNAHGLPTIHNGQDFLRIQ